MFRWGDVLALSVKGSNFSLVVNMTEKAHSEDSARLPTAASRDLEAFIESKRASLRPLREADLRSLLTVKVRDSDGSCLIRGK